MKRLWSLILAAVLACSLLSGSALAAEGYPQEFLQSKTEEAVFHGDVFFALQEDGDLWAMGNISMFGKKGPYDRKVPLSEEDDLWLYYTDYPKKIAEDVASFQSTDYALALIKTDGSLWVTSLDEEPDRGLVKKLDHVTSMSLSTHILAVQEDGALWAWGVDWHGELGIGNRVPNPSGTWDPSRYSTDTPMKVMEGVDSVDSYLHSIALKQDGSVWCWGYNYTGAVGTGELPTSSGASFEGEYAYILYGVGPAYERTPVKVMEDAKKIFAGPHYSLAIKNDDSLWAWGEIPGVCENLQGMPTPVKLAEDVKEVFCGVRNLLILKNDQTLWGCGYYSETPQKLADDAVTACTTHKLGLITLLKSDGTLWDVDLNETPYQAFPHPGGIDEVVFLESGIAIKENGSLFVDGFNGKRYSDDDFYHVGVNGMITTPIQLAGPANTPLRSASAAPQAAGTSSFTDVAADAYYYDAIQWAVQKEITAGTTATTFSPMETCTTAQILTFLWRANGSPEPTIANPFTDVAESAYYYRAALWASEKGLVSGTALGADTPCTRSQTVTYLWLLAGRPSASSASAFDDVDSGAEYGQAVSWAVEQEITSGISADTFAPERTCTRGQIATFLYRDMGNR